MNHILINLSSGIIGSLELYRILAVFSMAKREEFILYLGGYTKRIRAFHILDSLKNTSSFKSEGKLLQDILLTHFQEETFMEDRISVNIAQANFSIYLSIFYSCHEAGASSTKYKRLRLLYYLFRKKVFF
jgi:hypothetical protein